MKEKSIIAREYRENLIKDPYRPVYHFAVPDGVGMPGDPNGAFFQDGVYHLMYLYRNLKTDAYHWGHISSVDLLHWREHPDSLIKGEDDDGCCSGGAFVDEDKTAYLTFLQYIEIDKRKNRSTGIGIAVSKPPYEKWKIEKELIIKSKPLGITTVVLDGEEEHLGCHDPSNIWKINGYYYVQTGNKTVLESYGNAEESPEKYKGDWTELYRSNDLKNWEYLHRFYDSTKNLESHPDIGEDAACPCILPLFDAKENGNNTGKYIQLFISHLRGCQYYIGEIKDEKFYPEKYGRMSWNDKTYFAPEGLVDDKNRCIFWTWLHNNPEPIDDVKKFGWTGVFGFPRVIWLNGEELNMAPAEELDRLMYNYQSFEKIREIPVKNGESFRIKAEFNSTADSKTGLRVREDEKEDEYTDIYVDFENNTLTVDATKSGRYGEKIKEEAPFLLKENEKLKLDIFVDKSVVEVYANERQAICRRVYPTNPEKAVKVKVIGNTESIEKLEAWEIFPSNMY